MADCPKSDKAGKNLHLYIVGSQCYCVSAGKYLRSQQSLLSGRRSDQRHGICSILQGWQLHYVVLRKKYEFTAAFGGGRRDEEKSRAKERIFSFRNEAQAWDPKNQRPEMWKLYNTKINKGESIRVFPISNWTEKDIWQYIKRENIEIVPLYFAKERPVVYRDGNIIMVDDDRFKFREGEKPEMKKVRFRTLGCYPLTGGVESDAETLDEIIDETLAAVSSERTSRVIDNEAAGSMERRKREGYF